MTLPERVRADLVGTGLTVGPHPVAFYRPALQARGILRAADLEGLADGLRVKVAGAVICRQRPGTAKGFLFLTLEDETGLINVTVRPDLYHQERDVLVTCDVLEVEGALQTREGISVRAMGVRPALVPSLEIESRDFR
jgi:error-prone DNA polymerase